MTIRHIGGREDWYVITADQSDPGEPSWKQGKAILHGDRKSNNRIEASVSWSILRRGFGVGWRFGRNGMESDCGLDIYLGPLASFWLRLYSPWTKWLNVNKEKHPDGWYEPRHTAVKIHDFEGNIIRAEWDSADNGPRSARREWKFMFSDIWGHTRCDTEIIDTGTTQIPMPEGNYPATYKIERRTWRHVRWPGKARDLFGVKIRTSAWLDIDGGIPVEGKGENSWDCGMDGIFGCGGANIEDAVAHAVRAVLRDRKRYGGPHNLTRPMTVQEAESA